MSLWTPSQDAILRREYKSSDTAEIAALISKSVTSVYQRAYKLGLVKGKAYKAGLKKAAIARLERTGAAWRFPKGNIPHNAGKKAWWNPGRSVGTRFKPGDRPHTWRPIGSTRISKDGHRQRKVTDTGCSRRDWVGLHIIKWRRHRGDVPRGFVIAFRDRNPNNILLSNLEMISRAELMRRNSIQRLPEELKEVIRAVASLKRQIKKESHGKKQIG